MIDESPGDDGGYKNVVMEVKGDSVYSKMKWEAGVHRVQRVRKYIGVIGSRKASPSTSKLK